MATDLNSLARDDVLRAAINTGNRALVQQDGDVLRGVSPALARRLADEIGARLDPVIYDGAGAVFRDAEQDRWDVGFLAIDATRAEIIGFTRPYVTIEATFAVRADSPITNVEQVDSDGMMVLTSTGSAYDMYLTATLKHADLVRCGLPLESFEAFQAGRGAAVAGVRASLERQFATDPAVRILPGVLTSVEQAMVLPDRDDPRLVALDAFVAQAMAEGFVTRALEGRTET